MKLKPDEKKEIATLISFAIDRSNGDEHKATMWLQDMAYQYQNYPYQDEKAACIFRLAALTLFK